MPKNDEIIIPIYGDIDVFIAYCPQFRIIFLGIFSRDDYALVSRRKGHKKASQLAWG